MWKFHRYKSIPQTERCHCSNCKFLVGIRHVAWLLYILAAGVVVATPIHVAAVLLPLLLLLLLLINLLHKQTPLSNEPFA